MKQFHIGDLIKFTRDGAELEGRIKKLPQINVAIVDFNMTGVSAELTVNLDQAELIEELIDYDENDYEPYDLLRDTFDLPESDFPFKINP